MLAILTVYGSLITDYCSVSVQRTCHHQPLRARAFLREEMLVLRLLLGSKQR